MKEFLQNLIDKGGNIIIKIDRSNVVIGNGNSADGFRQMEYPQNQRIDAPEKKQGQVGYDADAQYFHERGTSDFYGFFR